MDIAKKQIMSLRHPFAPKEMTEDNACIMQCAIDIAMAAGKIQFHKFRSRGLDIETKSNLHDLVTEVDKECEALIIDRIHQAYPSHSILSEETGMHRNGDSDWEWVVDPLDGTNNYSEGLPMYCVSIGVQYKGVTQVGVVYAPSFDSLYTAIRGEGAQWNGKQIRVNRKTDLNECIVATGFPYDKATVGQDKNNLDNVCRMLPQLRGLRRMGSAAFDLCCVACGMLDGYWELNLNAWDACAGMLIVEEAGGIVRSFRDDRKISIAAGYEPIVKLILENVK